MAPQRLSIKLYFADGAAVDPPRFVPLLHGWIRGGTVEGLLIDVADYKHAHRGPATVLVGHEMDYALDLSEGRPGLVVTRKRPVPREIRDDLRQSLRLLLLAARALGLKADPHPPVSFRTDELRLQALDRLSFPNTAEKYTSLRGELQPVLGEIYGDVDLKIEHASPDPRAPLTLRVTASPAPALDTLLARLAV